MSFDWIEVNPAGNSADSLEGRKDRTPQLREAARLRRNGFFGPAAEAYASALGHNEHEFTGWAEYVDTLIRARALAKADVASLRILGSYRQVRILYASRALVFAHSGQIADAKAASDISLSDSEPHPYPKCVRAELLLRAEPRSRRVRADAMELLDDAAMAARDPWEIHFIGGCALMDSEWHAHAAAHFSEAIHADPTATAAWVALGDCFTKMRLYDQATFYYDEAMRMEPALSRVLDSRCLSARMRYGLMRVFDWRPLRKRWEQRYNLRKERRWEPGDNGYR